MTTHAGSDSRDAGNDSYIQLSATLHPLDPLSEIPEEFESLVLVWLALEGLALVVERGRHKPSGPEQKNWDVTQPTRSRLWCRD